MMKNPSRRELLAALPVAAAVPLFAADAVGQGGAKPLRAVYRFAGGRDDFGNEGRWERVRVRMIELKRGDVFVIDGSPRLCVAKDDARLNEDGVTGINADVTTLTNMPGDSEAEVIGLAGDSPAAGPVGQGAMR